MSSGKHLFVRGSFPFLANDNMWPGPNSDLDHRRAPEAIVRRVKVHSSELSFVLLLSSRQQFNFILSPCLTDLIIKCVCSGNAIEMYSLSSCLDSSCGLLKM